MGVGTASALITITLAGNVVITDQLEVGGNSDFLASVIIDDDLTIHNDLFVDGELDVGDDLIFGTSADDDDDFIRFDGGNEFIQWDESETLIRFSDHIATGGHAQFGSISPDGVNRFGDGTPTAPESMTGFGDLYLADDLEVTSDLYVGGTVNCPNCILGFYIVSFSEDAEDENSQQRVVFCDPGDKITGGGYHSSQSPTVRLDKPLPDGVNDTEGWLVFFSSGIVDGATYGVQGICADYSPAHIP